MKHLLRYAAVVAGLILTLNAAVADSLPVRYGVQVLSDTGRQPLFPLALNNNLQFVAEYGFDHPIPAHFENHFVDFNDQGETLGWSYRDCCDFVIKHYYQMTGGTQIWLDDLYEANAINDSSVIAGSIATAGGNQRAVLYDNNGFTDLGTLGGASSSATDINNNGDAIGWSNTANGETHPFLYRDGIMQDLSELPGWVGSPNAINDHGQMVVSYRDEAFRNHVLFYSEGIWQEILVPGAAILFVDLNNLGQVLLSRQGFPRPGSVLWQDGQAYDLLSLVDPSAPYNYSEAVDMNDNGQILLRGCSLTDSEECSILMLQPVPEPSTWALLLAGLGMLAWTPRRQGTNERRFGD